MGRTLLCMSSEYVGKTTNGYLPNITGYFNVTSQGIASSSGCYGSAFTSKGNTGAISAGKSGGSDCYQQLDASRSSVIYNSETSWYSGNRVIPSAVAMCFYIKY